MAGSSSASLRSLPPRRVRLVAGASLGAVLIVCSVLGASHAGLNGGPRPARQLCGV